MDTFAKEHPVETFIQANVVHMHTATTETEVRFWKCSTTVTFERKQAFYAFLSIGEVATSGHFSSLGCSVVNKVTVVVTSTEADRQTISLHYD